MIARMITFLLFLIVFLLIDIYLYQAIITVTKEIPAPWRAILRGASCTPSALAAAALLWLNFGDPYVAGPSVRSWVFTGLFATYLSKTFGIIVLFFDDIGRGIRWVAELFSSKPKGESLPGDAISRSEFLSRTALIAASIPFGTMAYGILSGAHDYRVRPVTVARPNLPSSFDGIKIGHISDIHS